MNRKNLAKYIFLSAFGLSILIMGLVLLRLLPDAQGKMRTLPYICIGIGAGLFGGNLGTSIKLYLLQKDPKTAKKVEIEAKDELNVAINHKAKAKAYDLMQVVFPALMRLPLRVFSKSK